MKEFRILEFRKAKHSVEEIENVLAQKSAEGWEVVSLSSDLSVDIRGAFIVLLQREKPSDGESIPCK